MLEFLLVVVLLILLWLTITNQIFWTTAIGIAVVAVLIYYLLTTFIRRSPHL